MKLSPQKLNWTLLFELSIVQVLFVVEKRIYFYKNNFKIQHVYNFFNLGTEIGGFKTLSVTLVSVFDCMHFAGFSSHSISAADLKNNYLLSY